MTITLRPEQEQLLRDAIDSGLAQTPDEALDQARRLASFGKRHGLSLGEMTMKDLLRESRP